jgi:hypothetical protein
MASSLLIAALIPIPTIRKIREWQVGTIVIISPLVWGVAKRSHSIQLKCLLEQQKIPLVFVNLPLTQDYLDSVRQTREQQFQQWMQRQVGEGFVFIDLGRQGLTENQYFADPSHLNRYGAAAVSRQLAANSQIPWPQPRP